HQPEFERRPAMRTMQLQEADRTALVAKHHQLLAQDRELDRHVVQFVGVADRLPEAAKVLAARRVRPDMRELAVLAGHAAVVVAAKPGFEQRRTLDHRTPPGHDGEALTARRPNPIATASRKREEDDIGRCASDYIAAARKRPMNDTPPPGL